jgi:hypothetical protein
MILCRSPSWVRRDYGRSATYANDIALDGSFLGRGTETPDAIAGGAVGTVGGSFFDGIFILLEQP